MRNPHAVWNSMFKYHGRLVDMLRKFKIERNMRLGADTQPVAAGSHMENFLMGGLQLPPRIREQGAQFGWPKHLRGWEEKLRTMREERGQPVHIVDFDSADPLSTVTKITAVVHAAVGATRSGAHANDDVGLAAEDIVQRTSYSSIREQAVNRHGARLDDLSVAVHLAPEVSASWRLAFSQLAPTDRSFFEAVTTRYRFILDNEQYRSSGFVLA
jgi:hypothetical protein